MIMAAEDPSPFHPVKSADRVITVLESLADGGSPSLNDLSQQTGIPKSSLHGLLRTLEARGWVQSSVPGPTFRLGIRAMRVAGGYLDNDEAATQLVPIVDTLARRCGETVQVGRLEGAEVCYLVKRQSAHPIQLVSTVGGRLPANVTALGKALLAERSAAELDALLSFPLPSRTPASLSDRDGLYAELDRVRDQGYATDNEEAAPGLRCFAIAVPWRHPAIDAISISMPAFRATPEACDMAINLLLDIRRELGLPGHRPGRGRTVGAAG
jgi:DNA-binding IclR family transcriptional regulator